MNLSDKKLQDLKDRKISVENLYEKYLYTEKDGVNVENILKLLNENICDFKWIVDKYVDSFSFSELLGNRKLFEVLIEDNKLNKNDLKYLLNKIDKKYELSNLCNNTPLIKCILNEFVLDKNDVDKFYTIIENNNLGKNRNIHTIFDLIKSRNRNNKEILNLNELNRYLHTSDLNENQRDDLIEVLKDNEQSRNMLILIVEYNLQDQYDFESLKNLLSKDENKRKLELNI